MSKTTSLQQQPALKRCQSNVQPFKSSSEVCTLEPIKESEPVAESKDDGGLLKCMKIEVKAEDEKSTGSSHEATSEDLNENKALGLKKHRRNQSVSDLFKERLVGYRKLTSKSMTFSDQLDMRNPQMVSEFATDIYTTMKA